MKFKNRLSTIAATICGAWFSVNARAVERLSLTSGPELALPSIWRVLLGFLIAVGVAFAVVTILRRMKPWLSVHAPIKQFGIVSITQRRLTRNLIVQVIEVDSQRFMIVESLRNTVVLPLNNTQSPAAVPAVSESSVEGKE